MRTTRIAALLLPIAFAVPGAFAQSEADRIRAEWRKEALSDLERGDPAEQIRAAKSLDVEFAARTAPILAKHLSNGDAAIRLSAASLLWTLAGK